jgi:hypothetical protein
LLRNITEHAEFLLGQPATTGSNLLCETILDHMYTLGMVYQLSTNATVRSRVAQRATAELLSTAALASWCGQRLLEPLLMLKNDQFAKTGSGQA